MWAKEWVSAMGETPIFLRETPSFFWGEIPLSSLKQRDQAPESHLKYLK